MSAYPKNNGLQPLASRQLLNGDPLRLQPVCLGDDWQERLTPMIGAIHLKLLQQCLEPLVEVVERKRGISSFAS